ncbi:MAG: hypothetical protein JO244_04465 [Solirubrobacterales bacterium]|nr:hypothetical protein [Solirubrobacterales bacterium]
MPQIIVRAGDAADLDGTVTLRERISISDFESERFTANLVERLGWAVNDAAEVEQLDPVDEQKFNEPKGLGKAPELVEA